MWDDDDGATGADNGSCIWMLPCSRVERRIKTSLSTSLLFRIFFDPWDSTALPLPPSVWPKALIQTFVCRNKFAGVLMPLTNAGRLKTGPYPQFSGF